MTRTDLACLLLTLAALLACGSVSDRVRVGKGLWSIECRTRRYFCHREATEACPNGFDVLESGNRSMMVRCWKNKRAKKP